MVFLGTVLDGSPNSSSPIKSDSFLSVGESSEAFWVVKLRKQQCSHRRELASVWLATLSFSLFAQQWYSVGCRDPLSHLGNRAIQVLANPTAPVRNLLFSNALQQISA